MPSCKLWRARERMVNHMGTYYAANDMKFWLQSSVIYSVPNKETKINSS